MAGDMLGSTALSELSFGISEVAFVCCLRSLRHRFVVVMLRSID